MTVDKSELVTIRDLVEEDKAFIYATFLRGIYYGDTLFGEIPKDVFMTEYHKIIENILATPNRKVRVACLKEDPNVILGYSVSKAREKGDTLDFIFVKAPWRKIGIGKSLLPENVIAATHATKLGLLLLKLKLPGVKYNPWLV